VSIVKRSWIGVITAVLLFGIQIVVGMSLASFGASASEAQFIVSATAVKTNEAVLFDASSSRSGRSLVLYEWDFDGDGAPDAVAGTSTIEHVYRDDGVFTVRLRIVDEAGLVTTSSVPVAITVANRAPAASLGTLEGTARAEVPVQFTGTAGDEDGAVVAWAWEFGDGSRAERIDPTHTYETPGTYIVRLTVADDDGATSETVSTVLLVEEAPPIAAFTSHDESADSSLAVWFVDTTATSSPTNVIHVGWDFGDGVYRATGGPSADGVYVHIYESPGMYFVTLYVIDKFGAMSTISQTVWIRG
jgi:PKD repeat protein